MIDTPNSHATTDLERRLADLSPNSPEAGPLPDKIAAAVRHHGQLTRRRRRRIATLCGTAAAAAFAAALLLPKTEPTSQDPPPSQWSTLGRRVPEPIYRRRVVPTAGPPSSVARQLAELRGDPAPRRETPQR